MLLDPGTCPQWPLGGAPCSWGAHVGLGRHRDGLLWGKILTYKGSIQTGGTKFLLAASVSYDVRRFYTEPSLHH